MKKILSITIAFLLFLGIGFLGQGVVAFSPPPPELSCDDFELGVRYERIWQGQEVTLALEYTVDAYTVDVWGATDNTNYHMHLGMKGATTDWNVNPWQGSESLFTFYYDTQEPLTLNPNQKTAMFSVSTGSPGTPFGFYFGERQIKLGFNVHRESPEHGVEELWCEKEVEFEVIYETQVFDEEPPREDYVYVAGDEIKVTFENLPTNHDAAIDLYYSWYPETGDEATLSTGAGYGNTSDPNGNYGDDATICFQRNLVEGLQQDQFGDMDVWCKVVGQPSNGELEFTGTVKEGVEPPGEVYFVLIVTDSNPNVPDVIIGHKPFLEGDGGPDSKYIFVGMEDVAALLEETLGVTFPDLLNLGNLYETTEPATFGKAGIGSITFAPGLNILGHGPELEHLATEFNIEYDAENNRLRASVNTEVLTFLAGVGATIQFDNAMALLGAEGITEDNILDFIDIYVYDGGTLVEDLSDYLDLSGIVYDDEYDILYIPVNHFTDYEIRLLGDTEEIPETGVQENFTWLLIVGVMLAGSAYLIRKKLRA